MDDLEFKIRRMRAKIQQDKGDTDMKEGAIALIDAVLLPHQEKETLVRWCAMLMKAGAAMLAHKDGKDFDGDLVGSSQSTYLRLFREAAGVPSEEWLAFIRTRFYDLEDIWGK